MNLQPLQMSQWPECCVRERDQSITIQKPVHQINHNFTEPSLKANMSDEMNAYYFLSAAQDVQVFQRMQPNKSTAINITDVVIIEIPKNEHNK